VCIDQAGWRFRPYPKHETPPSFRDKDLAEIDRLTVNADSRYYPQHQPSELEAQVVGIGLYVYSPKRHTIYKVLEFAAHIGASKGTPSRWVKVEVTNGEYHGRPITSEEYARFVGSQIPCCA
jgi:hypothetical protein